MSHVQHVFIVGSKGLGNYGGYETFVDKLTEQHQENAKIKYHIACKFNGQGMMDEKKIKDAVTIDQYHFKYHNADCFKIEVPEWMGSAQALFYDVKALKESIRYCKENKIDEPIFYVLACRIGPFIGGLKKKIHEIGGMLYINPDGHEWMRAKWSRPVRKYWKESERLMVKNADLLVCDSINIENYIHQEYSQYNPETVYIAYGADIKKSELLDNDPKYVDWMTSHGLKKNSYYLVVGRFVPENNFETMIREFMKSHTKRTLAIVTTRNDAFLEKLNEKLHFKEDSRINFVGTVYDQDLLKKIRENAYGYFHGHSVGGTNPSLLEAMESTELNLLLNVGFNKEVAQDSALYWNKKPGNLAALIDKADSLSSDLRDQYGLKAKDRIRKAYSWDYIAERYAELFGVKNE